MGDTRVSEQASAMEPPGIDEATSIPAVGAFTDLLARLDPDTE